MIINGENLEPDFTVIAQAAGDFLNEHGITDPDGRFSRLDLRTTEPASLLFQAPVAEFGNTNQLVALATRHREGIKVLPEAFAGAEQLQTLLLQLLNGKITSFFLVASKYPDSFDATGYLADAARHSEFQIQA